MTIKLTTLGKVRYKMQHFLISPRFSN